LDTTGNKLSYLRGCDKLLKTLTRTVAVECYASRYARRALREIERTYRDAKGDGRVRRQVQGIAEHTTQSLLPKVQGEVPLATTRVIKGAYRDAVRREVF